MDAQTSLLPSFRVGKEYEDILQKLGSRIILKDPRNYEPQKVHIITYNLKNQ